MTRAWQQFVFTAMVAASVRCVPSHGPGPAEPQSQPQPPSHPAPRLVVVVVIDQLPSWSFEAQRSELHGGIGRLLARGVYWPEAWFPYAGTHTAPGHATIATGAPPSVHGIVANRWIDPSSGEHHEVTEDAAVEVLDPRGGPSRRPGVSNARLEVDGVAEALHAEHPDARAIAIALKGRAAAHVLGRHPDLALWFDSHSGALTSSTSFVDALPAWVSAFAEAHPREGLLAQPWSLEDPERLAALAGGPDDRPDEGDPQGLGHVYPHALTRARDPARAFAYSPMANTLLVDAAIAAIEGEALGRDESPDLLAISFSSHDYAGHAWCQESWERTDHLLTIDRELSRLVDALDHDVGVDRWALVLTADHGATRSRASGGELVLVDTITRAAKGAAKTVLGAGDWIAGASDLCVVTTPAFDRLDASRRDPAYAAILAAIRALPGVGYAERTDRLVGDCDAREGVAALACRSNFPGRSGGIYLAAAAGSLINDDPAECTAHGSPNDDDRSVPLVIVAPGLAARRDEAGVSMLRVAPTIAELLGVAPPAAAHEPGLLR